MLRHQTLKNLKRTSKELCSGLIFEQETVTFGNQVSNCYACIFDKSLFAFELFSSTRKHSLREIVKAKFKDSPSEGYCVGINTNAFLMAEDGPTPKTWSYNLDVLNGTLLQIPANVRPTIMTKNGRINFRIVEASGQIVLDKKSFTWKGSHTFGVVADFTAYGTFSIPQFRTEKNGKKFISSSYDSSWIPADKGDALLGFNLMGGNVKLGAVSDEKLNLFDFLFILKGSKEFVQGITSGCGIDSIVIDTLDGVKDLSAQSLISKIPREKNDLESEFGKYLIKNTKVGNNRLESFRKAWSVILQIQNSIIFLMVDARPKIVGQEGLNIFELHELLTTRFDFSEAFVSDAGQSSKICIYNGKQCNVYGNLHYLDYVSDPPVWRGTDGRFVPGALLAYNRLT